MDLRDQPERGVCFALDLLFLLWPSVMPGRSESHGIRLSEQNGLHN